MKLIGFRNVKAGHLEEIFGHYGEVEKVDLEKDQRSGVPKGSATITFKNGKDAEQAVLHMDGGQLDGLVLKVSYVLIASNKRRRESDGYTNALL